MHTKHSMPPCSCHAMLLALQAPETGGPVTGTSGS